MTANEIFRNYVRFMGVGAIATAGIFGIIKSLKVVVGSFSIAVRAFKHGEHAGAERTDIDMPIVVALVSGGHTMLVAMHDHGRYQVLGSTVDDAAGEAFDKVGKLLGLRKKLLGQSIKIDGKPVVAGGIYQHTKRD